MRPELGPSDPILAALGAFGNITVDNPVTDIYPSFKPLEDWDVVLQKVRYYAGAGNGLEEILSSQHIDTVVLVSSIRRSPF